MGAMARVIIGVVCYSWEYLSVRKHFWSLFCGGGKCSLRQYLIKLNSLSGLAYLGFLK